MILIVKMCSTFLLKAFSHCLLYFVMLSVHLESRIFVKFRIIYGLFQESWGLYKGIYDYF